MKWNRVLFALSLALPILVAAEATVEVTKTVEVTRVSTVLATPTATSDGGGGVEMSPTDNGDPGFTDPNAAGASGKDSGAFTLSKGGLIAIITVVSIVAVFGIASTILWYLAKKRSWEVRASLRRVSRRLTGRMDDSRTKRQSRRTGVRMQSPPRSKRDQMRERDLEKGRPTEERRKPTVASAPKAEPKAEPKVEPKAKPTAKVSSTFEVETPAAKSWKSKFTPGFGGKS